MMFGVPLGVQRINEPWNPSMIPEIANGTGAWFKSSNRVQTFQDSALTTPAVLPGDPVGAYVGRSVGNFIQSTDANRLVLVDWGNGYNALHFADATDLMSGSNGLLAAQNAIGGQTIAFVMRTVAAFGASHRVVNIALNGGGTKFSVYFETDGSMRILSRRIATDAQDARVGPTLATVTKYVVVAGVKYKDSEKRIVLDVNNISRIDAAPAWTGGDTCEALNAASFTLGFAAAPPTGVYMAELIWYPRMADAYERSLLSHYLNSHWKAY